MRYLTVYEDGYVRDLGTGEAFGEIDRPSEVALALFGEWDISARQAIQYTHFLEEGKMLVL